jgi:outer membrane protein TolC
MEMAMRVFAFILFLFSFVPAAFATEAPLLSWDDLLQRLKQHPEIQAYVSRAESSRHYAEGELGLPDPMLNFQVQDYPIGSSRSSDFEEKMIGFKQEIPRPGIRRAKSEKMQTEARKTGLMADYAFAAMKAQLITVFANRQSLKEQEKLLDEQEDLFRSERGSITGRIAANQSGASQFSMNQADSSEIEIMRAELTEQVHEGEVMLTNMLGEAPEIALPEIKMAVWDNDPEKTYSVKIAAEDVAVAQKEVAMRTAEFGPNFEVAANYGRMNNGDNAGTVMVGVSIPFWSAESQKPRLAGANAALHSSRLDLDSVKRGVMEKLDHLKAQVETSDRKIELLKEKNTHLEASAKALTREYGAGKADFSMYLKARRDALSARMTLAREQARNTALIADFNHYFIEGEHP